MYPQRKADTFPSATHQGSPSHQCLCLLTSAVPRENLSGLCLLGRSQPKEFFEMTQKGSLKAVLSVQRENPHQLDTQTVHLLKKHFSYLFQNFSGSSFLLKQGVKMTIKGQKTGAKKKKKSIHKPAKAIKILNVFHKNGACKKSNHKEMAITFLILKLLLWADWTHQILTVAANVGTEVSEHISN